MAVGSVYCTSVVIRFSPLFISFFFILNAF